MTSVLELPSGIAESLYSVVYTQRALAYLHIDRRRLLAGAGGHLDHYGLEGLRLGCPAQEQVVFLEGFLPPPESPFFVRAVEFPHGRAADLQFYADRDSVWVVLVDVTAERDAARRVQQKAYEMTLLQEKEARLNRSLQAANAALRAAQAELERSRAALAGAYERLDGELAQAASYVRSILPAPMSSPFRADWRFVPSARLGGDSFGYHWIDDRHFCVYLLDVCGHGLGASLLSIGVLNALRSGALPHADLRDPARVIQVLNDLFQMERHNNLFFSLWYGVYQPAACRLEFAGAGHPPSVLVRFHPDGTRTTELLKGRGPPVGVDPVGQWPSSAVRVEEGNRLYVLSDGTYEITRPDGTMMELADLVRVLEVPARASGSDLDELLGYLRSQRGSDELEDDLSILRFDF